MSNTIELHRDRWKKEPWRHQVDDVTLLMEHAYFGLLAEMGTGKTKTVIDTACELRYWQKIDIALVIAPASVRSVWTRRDDNPELMGEIQKHAWLKSHVMEYHSSSRVVWTDENPELYWLVTNYEFIRQRSRFAKLVEILGNSRYMMICDESSFIKNRLAAQTKACVALGKKAARRVILNGTPMNNPLDLWAQMNFLSPDILPYANFYAYRATFADMDVRHGFPKITGWKNLDMLQRHIAPYVTRREKKDCLDLPPKLMLPPVEVRLTEKSWRMYKEMRDEMVVWLDKNPSLANQGGVKAMRLLQITSGFIGGVIDLEDGEVDDLALATKRTEEVGREKLDWLIGRVDELLQEKPDLKIIVWCWFQRELERIADELKRLLPTYKIYGKQTRTERDQAEAVFKRTDLKEPALLAAQQAAGGFGLTLIAANTIVYMSNSRSLIKRQQSEDRAHRGGQTRSVTYTDVLACGPDGQKTLDHTVVKALREGYDLATWTYSAWKRALTEE